MKRQWLWAATWVVMSGCGGGATTTSEEATETSGEPTTGEEVAATEVSWAEMDHDQRAAFMRDTVMPEMQTMFQEHDAERFAQFNCATCHGQDAIDVSFEMPNGIAPLDPTHVPAMFESEQPMAVFMTRSVWPRMAEMLGQPPYDPETHEGFSCFNCHGMQEGG